MKYSIGAFFILLVGCSGAPVKGPAAKCVSDEGIFGRVVDERTGSPLWNVRVATDPETDITRTNRDGCFTIKENPALSPPEIKKGAYRVVVEPVPGEVKTPDGEVVAEVYNSVTTAPLKYTESPLSTGALSVSRLSAGESGEVIFTPDSFGRTGRTMDE